MLALQPFLVSITFEVLTFSLSHIGYEYSTTAAVLPRLLHSKANNEFCRCTQSDPNGMTKNVTVAPNLAKKAELKTVTLTGN